MSRLTVIAVGGRAGSWAREAEKEYCRRLRGWRAELRVAKAASGPRGLRLEARRIAKLVPPGAALVAADERGEACDSEQFARRLQGWLAAGGAAFVVGGHHGLDDAILRQAAARLALAPFTLAHDVARVALLEQCYRAWTILQGHPYHRG